MPSSTAVGYAELVRNLVEKTDNGWLDWKEDSTTDAFYVPLKSNSIIVRFNREGNVFLAVTNSAGKTIDTFLPAGTDPASIAALCDLYEKAKRRARNVDAIIEKVNDEINMEPI